MDLLSLHLLYFTEKYMYIYFIKSLNSGHTKTQNKLHEYAYYIQVIYFSLSCHSYYRIMRIIKHTEKHVHVEI